MKEQQMKQKRVQYKYTFGNPKNTKQWMVDLNESMNTTNSRSSFGKQNKSKLHCGHLGCLFESKMKTKMETHIKTHLEYNKHVKCYKCGVKLKAFPNAILHHTLNCHSTKKMSLGFILN